MTEKMAGSLISSHSRTLPAKVGLARRSIAASGRPSSSLPPVIKRAHDDFIGLKAFGDVSLFIDLTG